MPLLWELAYKGFYRLFQRISYIRVPVDAGDFSLIDRKVMDVLDQLPERDRFMRGLRAWAGFKQTGVPYTRPERMFGKLDEQPLSNFRWAKKGIFSFSYIPLEFISMAALFVGGIAVIAALVQIIGRIIDPKIPQGVSTIIVVCLFLGAVQLFSLSFIAEYLAKIFEEVKGRPLFVVAKTLNFEEAKEKNE